MYFCPNCFSDIELKGLASVLSDSKGTCECCFTEEAELVVHEEFLSYFQQFAELFAPAENGDTLINFIQDDWQIFSNSSVASRAMRAIVSELEIIESQDQLVNYKPEILEAVQHWNTLKSDLKEKNRYLINLDRLEEYNWDGAFNQQVQFTTGNNQPFYRARIHHESGKAPYPASEMGAPPLGYRKSGRANAIGISVLYVSLEKETTLYETRSSLLDELSLGVFQIKPDESLRLVDFTSNPSIFSDPGHMQNVALSKLLCNLISKDLSKPMRRYDSELEYVPTQFICEYIKAVTDTDGILFESSLRKTGKNAVIWDEQKLRCKKVEFLKISGVSISTR